MRHITGFIDTIGILQFTRVCWHVTVCMGVLGILHVTVVLDTLQGALV